MKRFIFLLTAIFICTIAYAHTINWHVGNTILEATTCDSGESITPPTAPYKYGYHFVKWTPYSAQIEYLESTGTQYIDTGVVATGGNTIETRITPTNQWFFVGSVCTQVENIPDKTRNVVFNRGSNTLYVQKGNNYDNSFDMRNFSSPMDIYLKTSNEYLVAKINNQILINNNNTPILQTQTQSVKLGYDNWDGTFFKQKNYYIKIWDNNDILVRDMIPVLDKDGVPCMYDRVEKKFYYNAGTGDFIAGPVIGE